MNLFSKFKNLFSSPSYPRTLAMIGILIIIIALPVTVFILQQRTNLEQHASACSGVCLPNDNGNGTCPSGYGRIGGTCSGGYLCCNSTTSGGTPNPCATARCGGGGYCGGNCGAGGDANTLYTCSGSYGSTVSTQACTAGCVTNPSGSDYCRTPSCTAVNHPGECQPGTYNLCTYVENYQNKCNNPQYINCVGNSPQCGYTAPPVPPTANPHPQCGNGSEVGTCQTSCDANSHDIHVSGCSVNGVAGGVCCASGAACGVGYTRSGGNCVPTSCTAAGDTCYTNNSCGSGQHEVTDSTHSCTSTDNTGRICCAAGAPAPSCPNFTYVNPFSGSELQHCDYSAPNFPTSCDDPNGYTPSVTTDPSGSSATVTCIYRSGSLVTSPSQTCATNSGSCLGITPQKPSCSALGSAWTYANNSDLDKSCAASDIGNGAICCVKSGSSATPDNNTPSNSSTNTNTGGNTNASSTPSCTNGQSTSFALAVKLQGIGSGSFENNTPLHPTRTAAYVRVTDESGSKIYDKGDMQFTYSNGTFNAPTIDLGTSATCGHTYTVTVKLPMYVKASNAVTYGSTTQTVNLNPIPGDLVANGNSQQYTSDHKVIGDDVIDPSDYNIIKSCHDDPGTTLSLTNNTATVLLKCPDLMNLFDFQDGGIGTDKNGISEFADNYNLWLKGYFQANGFK